MNVLKGFKNLQILEFSFSFMGNSKWLGSRLNVYEWLLYSRDHTTTLYVISFNPHNTVQHFFIKDLLINYYMLGPRPR